MSEYLQSVCIPVSCLSVSVSVSVCQSSQSLLYPIHPTSPPLPPSPLPPPRHRLFRTTRISEEFPHRESLGCVSASQPAAESLTQLMRAVGLGLGPPAEPLSESRLLTSSPHLTHLTSSTPPPLFPSHPPPHSLPLTSPPSPTPTPRNGPEQNHCDRRRPGPGALLLLRTSPGL